MNQLKEDAAHIDSLISGFSRYALEFMTKQGSRPAATGLEDIDCLPEVDIDSGVGAEKALQKFLSRYERLMSGSSGPNYYGFVTGGATPAGLIGDWLTSMFDQNAMGSSDSIAPELELQTINVFKDLLGISDQFSGSFVTGATMSSYVGLATARQWVAKKNGVNAAQQGLYDMKPIKVFSGTPHSSIYKSLSMSGIGRNHLVRVPTLANREAIDVSELELLLKEHQHPSIIVANLGTVNTVDFDDLLKISELKSKYDFWLHVDAAFGGMAGCSETHRHLIDGIDNADSITVDAHKWLNVPYDCAIQLSKHIPMQRDVFQNSAAYLSASKGSDTDYVNLTPENSRRLRAISVWMSIIAYGKNGYSEMVDRNVECAKKFGRLIDSDEGFVLLAPVRLNGVCFTLSNSLSGPLEDRVSEFLKKVQSDGEFFLTGTNYLGTPAIRLNVCNWQTEEKNILNCYRKLKSILG